MSTKQEILRFLRDQASDLSVGYDTDLEAVADAAETDLDRLVNDLESEFGIELAEDELPDVETVGDLVQMVLACKRNADRDEEDE